MDGKIHNSLSEEWRYDQQRNTIFVYKGDEIIDYFRVGRKEYGYLQAAAPDLKTLAELGFCLSTWAASIHWDGSSNTNDWLKQLKKLIEDYQAAYSEVTTKINGKNEIKKLRNQCFMCESVECYTRIYTEDFGFDEVACRIHAKALYLHANQTVDKSLNPIRQTGTTLTQREREA